MSTVQEKRTDKKKLFAENAAMKDSATGIEKILLDLFNYAQDGYQNIAFFFQIIGLSSTIYIALKVSGIGAAISYPEWISVLFVGGIPVLALFGYIYQRKTRLYARGAEINALGSPYAHWKLAPKEIPLYTTAMLVLERDQRPEVRVISEDMRNILKRNGITIPEASP